MRTSHSLRWIACATVAGMLAACALQADRARQGSPAACAPDAFAGLALPEGARILGVALMADGVYTPPGQKAALSGLPAFCRIEGEARPTADSLIRFEAWVPQGAAWNGKLVTTGNGGYSPALNHADMAYAMRQGYAVLGGDTGHQVADGNDMRWGIGHPEKIRDWGTRSVHAITLPGKEIVRQAQGRPASRAYFYGCSTGGHQGYAQVQRYPQDFDGVIAGAPGNNRVALNAEFLWRHLANRRPGSNETILTQAKVRWLTDKAIAACDAIDGVADGVIDDPRLCTAPRFDVDALLCRSGQSADCLSAAELDAVKKIYRGPRNPRTGERIYPGQVPGSEAGWPGYWGTSAPVRADFWRQWVFEDPQWDAWRFDFDHDFRTSLERLGPLVDHIDTDLSAFKARGGKLLTYQGWIDPVVSALDTIDYYERVRERQGSQAETDRFFRLFMAPGMDHCRGGPGPNVFGNSANLAPSPGRHNDALTALDHWVETGEGPQQLIAARMADGRVTRTRPLCAYPKRAHYLGRGSTDEAGNFECR